MGECPLMGGHARPVGTLQASQARPAPLKGAPFARAKPAREASPSGEVAAEQAGRVQPVDGGHNKVAGRACPAPTDCRESSCTRGAREGGSPPLPSWRVGDRKRAATQGPSESPSPLTRPAPFDKGASTSPLRGFGGAWRRTTSAASLLRKPARAVVCPAGANIARSPVSLRSTVAPGSQPRNPRI